ncbi:MAG: menaquinone biosynthesis protein [Candidatus Omnitrophica bacterium]|nr:menaquinone biosynthesis protein [Candidatus Omnitrophota bacterium]
MIRLGDIGFLNSWPVTYALSKGKVESPSSLIVRAIPADLNRQLINGQLEVSAISAFTYLEHLNDLYLLPDLAIGSDSGVNSVILVSRLPIAELQKQTVALTQEGATTPVLLRILMKRAYGVDCNYEVSPLKFPEVLLRYPAALIIGDEALKALPAAKDDFQTWDLGALWREWTHLPMVYAVWAARRDVAQSRPEEVGQIHEALLASKQWGLSHLEEVAGQAARFGGFSKQTVLDYYHGIRYDLDMKARSGLQRYAQEAQALGFLPAETADDRQRS